LSYSLDRSFNSPLVFDKILIPFWADSFILSAINSYWISDFSSSNFAASLASSEFSRFLYHCSFKAPQSLISSIASSILFFSVPVTCFIVSNKASPYSAFYFAHSWRVFLSLISKISSIPTPKAVSVTFWLRPSVRIS
jgi:hypothetical protein